MWPPLPVSAAAKAAKAAKAAEAAEAAEAPPLPKPKKPIPKPYLSGKLTIENWANQFQNAFNGNATEIQSAFAGLEKLNPGAFLKSAKNNIMKTTQEGLEEAETRHKSEVKAHCEIASHVSTWTDQVAKHITTISTMHTATKGQLAKMTEFINSENTSLSGRLTKASSDITESTQSLEAGIAKVEQAEKALLAAKEEKTRLGEELESCTAAASDTERQLAVADLNAAHCKEALRVVTTDIHRLSKANTFAEKMAVEINAFYEHIGLNLATIHKGRLDSVANAKKAIAQYTTALDVVKRRFPDPATQPHTSTHSSAHSARRPTLGLGQARQSYTGLNNGTGLNKGP